MFLVGIKEVKRMNNVDLIDSLSTNYDMEENEVVDIVYEVVCGNMEKYDSKVVADDIYMNWSWTDVLLLLKGKHPEYEIIQPDSLNQAADQIREYYQENGEPVSNAYEFRNGRYDR